MNLETLQKFCLPPTDERINQYAGSKIKDPFTIGQFSYATDGRMGIRVPALPGLPAGDVSIDQLFTGAFLSIGPLALASLEIPPLANYLREDEEEEPIRVNIGHHIVSHLLLNRLKQYLANVQIYPHPTDPNEMLYFTFDGGDGIMMPMKQARPLPVPNLNDEEKFKLCRLAITHLLVRIECDEKLRYHLGAGTAAFEYLTAAAAVLTGKTHEQVMDETIPGSASMNHQTIAEIMKTLEAA